MPNQIPINPTLSKNFDIKPNEMRSKAQLMPGRVTPTAYPITGNYRCTA